MKQSAFKHIPKRSDIFGGSLLKRGTNPKCARPLASKLPIHLVLRANVSVMRSPRNFGRVNDLVTSIARKYGVRIYEYANVGNHLHVLIKLPRRGAWAGFIREVTGRIALAVGVRQFWAHRPFTRVLNGWRKAYRVVKDYVEMNRWEADYGVRSASRDAEFTSSSGRRRGRGSSLGPKSARALYA